MECVRLVMLCRARVVVTHPAFVNAGVSADCPLLSMSCVMVVGATDGPYFQNCFQGGESAEFLRMSRRLARRIRRSA